MAERRMLSKKIFQSRQFLMMPFEAQALYTHLILSSDDDGVVEAFPIVRMIGANEDSLGLLVIKKFILPLNDDMVYFVTDFEEQNKIRADRVQPSRYRDLLLEKTNLVVDGKRVTSKTKYIDGQMAGKCLTNDGQMADKCQHSIGEYSIGKESIVKDNLVVVDDGKKSLSKIIKESNIKINERQTQQMLEYIALDDMKVDMIEYAIQLTEDAGADSFNYLNKILSSWKDKKLTTLEQVKKETEGYKKKVSDTNRPLRLSDDGFDPRLGF